MGMDKEISADVKKRRQRIRIVKLSGIACGVIVFFVVLI